jgi:von Willebrand factor type A domain
VRTCALLGAFCISAGGIAAAAPAAAEDPTPSLASSSLVADGETQSRGSVFFLRIKAGAGVAAVGSASVFERSELAHAKRVEFRAGPSRQVVATSQALLVPPGWPASAGASARSPHLVYALDARPDGVSLLEPAAGKTPAPGMRIRVLGLSRGTAEQEERFGQIVLARPTRFEIELDRPATLRGWAGAPVLLVAGGRLLGTLEPGIPEHGSRFGVTPVSFLVSALSKPLEHGAGRPFARFTAPALPVAPASGKLIETSRETRVALEVIRPANASAVPPEPCGIFVSGRARALSGVRRGFDVAIVIDTSLSTIEPTGADVNGNGIIGTPQLGGVSSLFGAAEDDPGDSILAAEVAAARGLLWELDPRTTRVALITFAGELGIIPDTILPRSASPPAVTREPLTREFRRIERALDKLLAEKPAGVTHMAAGVDQATLELLGQAGARSKPDPRSEKVMFFLTDGQPTLPFGPGKDAENVGAVLGAAERARAAGVRVHSFAIGPEALAGPVATVELAARTQGYFIPVREPGDLVDVVEAVHFPEMHDVVVRSLTTGRRAHPFHTGDDGYFSGLIAAESGENRIEITARADDGTAVRREIAVKLDPSARPLAIPAELAAARNSLLEECLHEMRDKRRKVEREQAERVRQELIVEIEREREKARIRAAEQRKELRIDIESP